MTTVRILLATRNGAAHLPEQLQSYLAQDHEDWALWVSDDRSSDGTWDILKAFRDDHPDREIHLQRGPGRGAAANFLSLLTHPDLPPGPVALSDQDDVWMRHRLRLGLDGLEGAKPVVSAGHTVETDAELVPVSRRLKKLPTPSFANALVQNILAGNTLTLNAAALAALRAGGTPNVPYHDWWIYLRMTGVGARVVIRRRPMLYYRQHGGNTLGAHRGLMAGAQRFGALAGGRYRHWVRENLRGLLEQPEGLLPAHRAAAEMLLTHPARLRALLQSGARRTDLAGRLILPALALTRRL